MVSLSFAVIGKQETDRKGVLVMAQGNGRDFVYRCFQNIGLIGSIMAAMYKEFCENYVRGLFVIFLFYPFTTSPPLTWMT